MNRLGQFGKGAVIGAITPLRFSLRSGHWRSALLRRAVDSAGQPIPSYAYPAIDFLSTLDFGDARVLEFGGGQSTVWWARRAASVTTIEHDPDWFRHVVQHVPANVKLVLCEQAEQYPFLPLGSFFDVVVVDGEDRYTCAQTALQVLSPDGLIVLDNAEGEWGPPGSYPIIDLLEGAGFSRVDFHGYTPTTWRKMCTSLFFNSLKPFRGLSPPLRYDGLRLGVYRFPRR